MMWQTSMAVLLVWFAVSVAAAVLVGRTLRRSGDVLERYAPMFQSEQPSSSDVVRVG